MRNPWRLTIHYGGRSRVFYRFATREDAETYRDGILRDFPDASTKIEFNTSDRIY